MINLKVHVAFIADWFKAIKKDNGYQTDLGSTVSTERLSGNGDDRKLACTVLLTDLDSVRKTPQRRDWQFEVIAAVRVPITWSSAESVSIDILEDLSRAVPTNLPATPDGLMNVEISKAEILRQPDGANYNVVGVTLRATCFEYTNKPA